MVNQVPLSFVAPESLLNLSAEIEHPSLMEIQPSPKFSTQKEIASGKPTKNYGKFPYSMAKSTISMAIFKSFLYVYQRVVWPLSFLDVGGG